uniref:NOL1/NOP2/NSUN 5/7 ferredoxin-like domain-containing protein n=1 Tax=Sinocyclocheilus grahami TaxID=75366 RepID=A0A672QGL2_SINGR
MVRKSGVPRRSSKRGSQISALKHLSLLDPAPPEPPLLQTGPEESPVCPDRVYRHAAAIFQSTHLEKPPTHRIISYGRRSEVRLPVAKDEASRRSAYQLAFNTLKSVLSLSVSLQPDDSMSLVAVMLTDLMDRKFLPRPPAANQEEEEVKAVQEVEACLLRFRTKLVASLARCRIKHELLTLENMVPEQIRHREERATLLPLYGWINTLRSSLEEVSEVLHTSGFSCVKSVGQLKGQTFCKDLHCHDLLAFPSSVKNDLTNSRLLSDSRLIIQDKSCCVGPWALWPLLADGGDVLMSGCFSAQTVAHVSAVAAAASSTVIVCLGDGEQSQTDELQNTLTKLGCKNSLESLDVSDARLQKISVVFLMPACSLSAVSNPVDYIMQENRGTHTHTLIILNIHAEHQSHVIVLDRFQTRVCVCVCVCVRLSSPSLLQDSIIEDDEETEEMKARFFRLEASDRSNGCFLALLTREPQPEVIETPQEVLARAAAKGLLDGLQPIKKEGRGRRSHRAPANQKRSVKTRPHATQSDQSRVAEFLNREMKGSSSETGSAPSPAPFSSSYSKSLTRLASVSTNDHHSSPPPAPPKGRQEVLRPATVTFPPVLLSSDGLLPQRWSHALPARPSPAHTNLQWRNSTPALPRSQTPFRLNHLRPWL